MDASGSNFDPTVVAQRITELRAKGDPDSAKFASQLEEALAEFNEDVRDVYDEIDRPPPPAPVPEPTPGPAPVAPEVEEVANVRTVLSDTSTTDTEKVGKINDIVNPGTQETPVA